SRYQLSDRNGEPITPRVVERLRLLCGVVDEPTDSRPAWSLCHLRPRSFSTRLAALTPALPANGPSALEPATITTTAPSGLGCKGGDAMTAIPCGFLAASLRPTPVEAPPAGVTDLDRWFSHGRLLLDKLDPLAFARYLIAFFIGVAAAVAWQS